MEEVACVRNKQSRDVGRYDCMDAGGSAASGTAAECNARSSCRDARRSLPSTAIVGGHDGMSVTKDFMFQLTEEEKAEVVANCDHLARLKFSPVLPSATSAPSTRGRR